MTVKELILELLNHNLTEEVRVFDETTNENLDFEIQRDSGSLYPVIFKIETTDHPVGV